MLLSNHKNAREHINIMLQANRSLLVTGLMFGLNSLLFAAPSVQVPRTSVDLGMVYAHTKQRANFVFKNTGDRPLKLEQVTSGCVACITVDLPEQDIRPGGKATVSVGIEPTSDFRNTVTIRTNDPKQPIVNLVVSGKAPAAAKLQPSFLYFGAMSPTEEWSGTTYVVPAVNHKFSVSVKSASKVVTAKIGKKNAKGSFPVLVVVKPNGTEGRISEHIEVMLDLPGKPVMDLLVLGESRVGANRPQ